MEMLALWGAVFTLLAAVLTVVVIARQFYKEYRDHRGVVSTTSHLLPGETGIQRGYPFFCCYPRSLHKL